MVNWLFENFLCFGTFFITDKGYFFHLIIKNKYYLLLKEIVEILCETIWCLLHSFFFAETPKIILIMTSAIKSDASSVSFDSIFLFSLVLLVILDFSLDPYPLSVIIINGHFYKEGTATQDRYAYRPLLVSQKKI